MSQQEQCRAEELKLSLSVNFERCQLSHHVLLLVGQFSDFHVARVYVFNVLLKATFCLRYGPLLIHQEVLSLFIENNCGLPLLEYFTLLNTIFLIYHTVLALTESLESNLVLMKLVSQSIYEIVNSVIHYH